MKTRTTLMVAFTTIVLIFIAGTYFYHTVEGWSYVDAFYFTGVTMTTIGYGDITPQTDIGKIFTVAFALISISVFLFIVSNVINGHIQNYMQDTYHNVKSIQNQFNRPVKIKEQKRKHVTVVIDKNRF